MIYENYLVDIPPKTKKNRQREHIYIYQQYNGKYDPKTKKMTGYKRRVIGRLDEENPTQMFPNENYLVHYGVEKIMQLPQQAPFSDTLSIGTFFALNKVMENMGFNVILEKLFDENADFIQALITYYIDDRSSVNQHFERYAYNNVTLLKNIPSLSKISKITNDDFSFDLSKQVRN